MAQSKDKENEVVLTKKTCPNTGPQSDKTKPDKCADAAKKATSQKSVTTNNPASKKADQQSKKTTSGSQSHMRQLQAQIQSDELHAEVAALTTQVKAEQAACKQLEAEVSKIKKCTKISKRITKPHGTMGKGLKLHQKMRLSKNKTLYLACLAREEQPYLGRFENDWSTAQILIQFMSNHHKNAIKQGRVVVAFDADGCCYLQDVKVIPKHLVEATGDAKEVDADEDADLDKGFGENQNMDDDLKENEDEKQDEQGKDFEQDNPDKESEIKYKDDEDAEESEGHSNQCVTHSQASAHMDDQESNSSDDEDSALNTLDLVPPSSQLSVSFPSPPLL
ncbi:hypothetical protein BN946_scf185004.g5 [Trametes cinnabarina]|uniref:Uncharacterized protein n=1 Tax=Pycnoporus cinnabarinus TaxID=5643 RepID=A0A060SKG8_PYCCI|nr:hypothetical protein BN946_scf185004.g5 [Trametes cinnabarina]